MPHRHCLDLHLLVRLIPDVPIANVINWCSVVAAKHGGVIHQETECLHAVSAVILEWFLAGQRSTLLVVLSS